MNRVILRTLQILLPLVVLGAAGFAAFTMIGNRPTVETQAPVFTPPGVRVHEVTLEQVQMSVTSQGTVRPRTESQLVPEIAGRITWVAPSFAEGGFFDTGDVLVKIDPFDYEQELVSTRSQLAQSRLRLAQEEAEAEVAQREWNDLGRGDPRELTLRKPQLDDAHASVAAAEAHVVRAERDLERADIVAPYTGRIRKKNVDIGQFVRVGDTIATVYSVDTAEIRLPLPDDQIAYLDLPLSYRGVDQQPQPSVTLQATFAGETHEWQGRVVRTESEIDPVSRMVHVVVEVADPYAPSGNPNKPPLAVGMYVEAEIEGRTVRDIAVVPRAALRGRDQVLVVTADDRLSFRDIDIFRRTTDALFVRAGLREGDLVVTSPLDTPTEGMVVQLANADPGLLARRDAAAALAPLAPLTPSSPELTPAAAESTTPPTTPVTAERAAAAAPPSEGAPERAARLDTPIVPRATSAPPAAVAAREPDPPAAAAADAPTSATAPAPAERAVGPNAVTVAPFRILNRDGVDPALGAAVTRAIADRLRTLVDVAMTSNEADARYVIGGSIQQVGPMVRVTAHIVDTADGSVLRALKIDGSVDEGERLEARVAAAVIEHVDIFRFRGAGDVPSASRAPALAVLPFNDLSAGRAASDVDLGAVITAAVTDRMASLSAVDVVASTDAATAEWVVRGGIQRIGDVVRVTARLIDVGSGSVVRAVKVDGTVGALAALQDQVASAIADAVQETVAEQVTAAALPHAAVAPAPVGRLS